jgi:hypothetical protein
MEWCKALNKEWGKYFYECQHCSVKPTKRNYKTPIPPANIIPDPVALDPMGECILSFMAKEKAETLLKQVEDADAKLNTLRKQCWRESQYWKKYNDAKYRFMPVYWRYKQAWKPYYELRDSRNDMLKQLQELNGVMEV